MTKRFSYFESGQAASTMLVIAVALVLIVGAFIYFGNTTDPTTDPELENLANIDIGDPPAEDRLEEVADEPIDFVGQNVTLQGEVAAVYDQRSLQLATTDLFENEILVISRDPLPQELLEDADDVVDEEEIVRVQGMIQIMPVVELERELGIDLDPQVEIELEENRPVIITDQVTVVRPNTFPDANNQNQNTQDNQGLFY